MLARALGIACLLAVALQPAAGARDDQGDVACTPRASQGYAAQVRTALGAGRDLWGERLIGARTGPTHAGAAAGLAPLLYARTAEGRSLTRSGVYYLPLALPVGSSGAAGAMLHVADGSQLLAGQVSGPSLDVLVGADGREPYGSCLARLTPARLARGWLPILQTGYRDAQGGIYAQESFSARAQGRLASFVRLMASAPAPAKVRLGPLSLDVAEGEMRVLHARWAPPRPPAAISADDYAAARTSVGEYWRDRLAAGARIDVPERGIRNAFRALLVQSLTLGWRYSMGNPYQHVSFPETVDVARVLGELGFRDAARAILLRALPARPTPYPNWKKGEKLLGFAAYDALYRDRATLEEVTPTLRAFVGTLERQMESVGLLPRERFSSDIPDEVYGLHGQAVVWQGLQAIATAWAEAGRPGLATRTRALSARLGRGLRSAVRRSQRPLPDGSLFLPMRLLDDEPPYGTVTDSRAGSYWNLVAPYALASGLFPPGSRESRGALRYLHLHGARLLGLVRTGAYVLYGPDAGGERSGVNPVYGNNAARFLASLDQPDRLVLGLYGQLATGMTPNTFVAGEGTTVAPLEGEYYRATYRPPNAAANAAFLETLRLALVHDAPDRLELAFATPRAWLAPGKRIAVRRAPTRFGPVSFTIDAAARSLRVTVDVPSRTSPRSVHLRLRLPAGKRIGAVTPRRPVDARTQTIDLSGLRDSVALVVRRSG